MDTSRLIINTIDKSSYDIQEETRLTGFTVVKAPKGPITPVRIPAGGASKLQDIFGVSSKEYPELYEVETFNKEYDVWVSAPYSEKTTVGTALVTTDGIFTSYDKIEYTEEIEEEVFRSEGLDTSKVITIDDNNKVKVLKDYRFNKTNKFKNGVNLKSNEYPGYLTRKDSDDDSETSYLVINTGISSLDELNGVSFKIKGLNSSFKDEFTISDADIKCENIRIGELEEGDDFYKIMISGTTSDSEEIITQKYIKDILSDEDDRKGLLVYWVDEVELDNIKGVIFPKYPSNRNLHISFAAFDNKIDYSNKDAAGRNLLKMTVYEDGAFHNASHKLNINGSLNPSDVDSNGSPIGFNESNSSYSNQDLIHVYSIDSGFDSSDEAKFNLNISKYPDIIIFGGERRFDILEEDEENIDNNTSLHNIGWEKVLDPDFSDVNIFFSSQDNTGKTLNDLKNYDKFFSLITNNSDGHNLGGYIFNYSIAPTEISSEGFDKTSKYLSFGRNYWNICNMAVIQLRDGSKIFSPMTGAKALMQCRIIEQRFGGVAPMWENEGNPGIGGQLDMINPVRLRYKYNKEQLDTLNSYNYNPVINDRQYGIMVVGQKTCKSGAITDWSYIGHACAFFEFIREVRANVMIPQIGKANNPYYRDLRAKQVLQYLRQRTEGDNRIWAAASVDTSTADGVNDVYARKALKFVINVSVTVDIFSEKVELNFTNEDQTSLVSYSDSTEE